MIAAVVLAGLACAAPGLELGQELEQVLALVRAGDFPLAAQGVEALASPLERAQARVFLEHHAGNLERALATARAAAEEFPEDPFLADRRVYIALSLRHGAESSRALESLRRVARDPHLPLEQRDAGLAQLARYEAEFGELVQREAHAGAARRVALWTVLAGLAACGVIGAWSLGVARRVRDAAGT